MRYFDLQITKVHSCILKFLTYHKNVKRYPEKSVSKFNPKLHIVLQDYFLVLWAHML